MVNIKVKNLVTHNPNLILLSTMCCFKAGHPFSICGDESLDPLLALSTILKALARSARRRTGHSGTRPIYTSVAAVNGRAGPPIRDIYVSKRAEGTEKPREYWQT